MKLSSRLRWPCSILLVFAALNLVLASDPQPIHIFKGLGLEGAAFSPTSTTLATWGDGLDGKPGHLTLRDLASGKERTLEGHKSNVWRAVFCPKGLLIAASAFTDESPCIFLWEVKSGKLQATFPEPEGTVSGLSFSPDGKTLAAASTHAIRIWNVDTRREEGKHNCEVPASTLAFSPDGKTLVAGCDDGSIRVFSEAGKKESRKFRAHSKEIKGVVFSPNGKLFVSGSYDGSFIVWKTDEWKPIKTIKTTLDRIFRVNFSCDGKFIAIAGVLPFKPANAKEKVVLGCVEFYSSDSLAKISAFRPHALPVITIDFSRDGRFLATLGGDDYYVDDHESARVWKLPDLIPLEK